MPPFLMSPLVKWALGAAGAAAAMHWVAKEWRRINDELDAIRPTPAAERVKRNDFPTLRRDPRTGEYRPM
jgi:hypothetical protein